MATAESVTGRTLVEAARALSSRIREAAVDIERDRRLPPDLIQAMKEAGVFRMVMPRAWGGPEADILTQIEVIEQLSMADGSVGWCAMIGSDGGYFSAFLEDAIGRELYADLDAVTAGVAAPTGRADACDGGYRVSGRWAFASGCQHSRWLVANCAVVEDGSPRLDSGGHPELRMCFLPAGCWEVIDTWTTTGLRGSGSHHVSVEGVFVSAERTFSLATSPSRQAGPLYAHRTLFLANVVGVPLGIARAAVDAMVTLAETKRTRTGGGLRDESTFQTAVARADALVGAARAYAFDVMGDIWASLARGDELTVSQRARYRLCIATVAEMCVDAVDLMYRAGGGTSLYAPHPLERHFRDIHTAQQHQVFAPKVHEATGRMLLGLEPGLPNY